MPPTKVLVCATAKPAERVKKLPITSRAGAERKVVMRLGRGTAGFLPFPDLVPGDELKVLAELAVTTDCFSTQQGDCVKQPYTFTPRVRARLLLADSARATARKRGHALLLDEQTVAVSQDQHHYVFVFEPSPLEIPSGWDARENYLSVALDANNRSAGSNHVLLIGANKKGDVQQDMGRISVVRLRLGDDPAPRAVTVKDLRTSRLPLTKEKRVVFSAPVERLRRDEQLVVGAMVEAHNRDLPYKARISTRLVLGDRPTDTDTGEEARKIDAMKGEISEHNGTNCLPAATQRTRKVGVLRVTKNAARTHHVNLVAESADPVKDRTEGSLALVRGSLSVTRYPASWGG
jgi:hypothetical protein